MVAKRRSLGRTHSARSVLWNRSTLPVVVGAYGAVNRCRTPFSTQTRSNNTGPGPFPNRAVNTLPLSVRTASGTRTGASPRPARHTPAAPWPAPSAAPTHRTGSDRRCRSPPTARSRQPDRCARPHPSATTPSTDRVPSAGTPNGAACASRPRPARAAPALDTPTSGPATAPHPHARVASGSAPAPTQGAPPATRAPAPPPPPASDADTTTAATNDPPSHPSHHRRHSGAATHAPSAAPRHTGGPPRSPARRRAPPARPDTAAPPDPAPPAQPGSPRCDHQLTAAKRPIRRPPRRNAGVSPTNRNWCRPPTGTASTNCRPGTEHDPSSINRARTVRQAVCWSRNLVTVHAPDKQRPLNLPDSRAFVVAGGGFEPPTSGL